MAVAVAKQNCTGPGSTNSVSLNPIEVPQALQSGEKFIKWDEVSCCTFHLNYKIDNIPFNPLILCCNNNVFL